MCDILLRSYPVCKQILENHAENEKKINFTSLQKKVSTSLGCEISHQTFEKTLAIVNQEAWKERKVILTVLVRCNRGLPGMKLWFQSKALGAISVIPDDYFEQKEVTSRLTKVVFAAYKQRKIMIVPEIF